MEFVNIGKESDYFLFAISDLYEEELLKPKIKNSTIFSFYRKGDNPEIDLFDKENEYALFYKPNLNEKGSVQIRMKIDMKIGIIKFWEKNRGVAKKNFVKAFENRYNTSGQHDINSKGLSTKPKVGYINKVCRIYNFTKC